MDNSIKKWSVKIDGRRTSISLEDAFYTGLFSVAVHHDCSLAQMISRINKTKSTGNLSSAIRLFVLKHYQTAARV